MMKTAALRDYLKKLDMDGEDELILNLCDTGHQFDCGPISRYGIILPPDYSNAAAPFDKLVLQLEYEGKKVIILLQGTPIGEFPKGSLYDRLFYYKSFSEKDGGEWGISKTVIFVLTEEGWGVRPFGSEAHIPIKEDQRGMFGATWRVVMSFFYILGASNVETVNHPAEEKINKKRLKNGKSPLREYSTIKINLPNVHRVPQSKGGTHASPISHERRSHRRVYKKTGKEIWVKSHVVKPDPNKVIPQRTYEVRF